MKYHFLFFLLFASLSGCSLFSDKKEMNFSNVRGWAEGKTPKGPEGFRVTKFAAGFRNPRWAYVGPNQDIFIAEAESEPGFWETVGSFLVGRTNAENLGKSANRITLLRDTDGDGNPELRTTFLSRLNQPLGMLILKGHFYVANTDGVWRYAYSPGQTKIEAKGEKIISLPAGGYNAHWTRNIITDPGRDKLYISVGSASNNGEHGMDQEVNRANILVSDSDGSHLKTFASGLRNPVGMDFHPESGELWTVVNERDGLQDKVEDYLAQVEEGEFYGWPYVYTNPSGDKFLDPRRKGERDFLLDDTQKPELMLGPHTSSLGLTFFTSMRFGQKYHNGAFIAQHGSWNSEKLRGYKVLFVPFKNGRPSGTPEDFLTGFRKGKAKEDQVYGRPTGITQYKDGLLLCDDAANTVWLIQKNQ